MKKAEDWGFLQVCTCCQGRHWWRQRWRRTCRVQTREPETLPMQRPNETRWITGEPWTRPKEQTWGGDKELTAVRLREGDDAVAVAVEERRVLVQLRRGGALRVAERRRPAHFTEPGTHEFSKQSRGRKHRWPDAQRKADYDWCPPAEADRLTNRTERRREAAKAQPPPPLGTPVVAEPCPSPFSGDSPSTGPCRARAQAITALPFPSSFLAVWSAWRSWGGGEWQRSFLVRVAVPPRPSGP